MTILDTVCEFVDCDPTVQMLGLVRTTVVVQNECTVQCEVKRISSLLSLLFEMFLLFLLYHWKAQRRCAASSVGRNAHDAEYCNETDTDERWIHTEAASTFYCHGFSI